MTLNKEYNTKLLLEGLEELNIVPTDEQVNRLLRYYELLIEWNEVAAMLTAGTTPRCP